MDKATLASILLMGLSYVFGFAHRALTLPKTVDQKIDHVLHLGEGTTAALNDALVTKVVDGLAVQLAPVLASQIADRITGKKNGTGSGSSGNSGP
jgi:hypothetical protein